MSNTSVRDLSKFQTQTELAFESSQMWVRGHVDKRQRRISAISQPVTGSGETLVCDTVITRTLVLLCKSPPPPTDVLLECELLGDAREEPKRFGFL